MNLIICDDNNTFSEMLRNKILGIYSDAAVDIYSSLSELSFKLADIAADIDAIFMDIQNKDGNGIDAAISITEKYPHIKIVYVTGYGSEFFQSVFKGPIGSEPVAFLTKPIEDEFLRNALARISEHSVTDNRSISIKSEGELHFIAPENIISVSGYGRKIIIETHNRKYDAYGRIKEILTRLPPYFIRCHRSCIINMRLIKGLEGWNKAIMQNGSEFPIGRSYKEEFKKSISENL